jgi:putative DNA primase/helicase
MSIASDARSANGRQRQQLGQDSRILLPHHLDELHASGLTDETIATAQIYSETRLDELARILDWRACPQRMAPAIVFPFLGPDGPTGYARIKPDQPRSKDGKLVRYESPRGRSNEIYTPTGTIAALNVRSVGLLITEGEKKALAADQLGYPTIGLVGVWGWKVGRAPQLLPSLERVGWPDRTVTIAFDSDVRTNEQVQAAEIQLAIHLRRRGAQVKVVRLPEGRDDANGNPTKTGLDDFLVGHGVNGFQALLDTAEDPAEPTTLEMKLPAKDLDPCSTIETFLSHHAQDGVSRLTFWRESFYEWSNGRFVERSASEIRTKLVLHLNELSTKLTTNVINNHLEQLRAQTTITSDIEAPSWLGDTPNSWAADEILPCRNGLVHIPSLVENLNFWSPASPRFLTTTATEFDFADRAAEPVEWIRFLNELWPGDPYSIGILQEWFGYSITLDTRQQKILLVIGPTRSGKGTIARILRRLVGKGNVAGPTLASLGERFGLQPLLNKSLAVISDARLGHRTDSSVVVERLLAISGEDALTVDRKHIPSVTCKLDTRLVVISNELPRLRDASGAVANRFLLLRLTESWLGREDPDLTAKLLIELPGILLWACEGWRRLRERGRFIEPEFSLRTELNELTSSISAFVGECCVIDPELEVAWDTLRDAYKQWCRRRGRSYVEDDASFGRNLRAFLSTIGDRQPRIDGVAVRHYTGIGLVPGVRPATLGGATRP